MKYDKTIKITPPTSTNKQKDIFWVAIPRANIETAIRELNARGFDNNNSSLNSGPIQDFLKTSQETLYLLCHFKSLYGYYNVENSWYWNNGTTPIIPLETVLRNNIDGFLNEVR